MVQIRTLLSAAVGLAFMLVLAVASLVWLTNAQLEAAYSAQTRAQQVAGEVASLLVLTHEYALHGEERAARQWRTRQAAIIAALTSSPEQRVPVENALAQAKSLPTFFEQLVAGKEADDDFQRRRTRLLLDQLLTQTQSLSDSVLHWNNNLAQERKAFESRFHILLVTVPVAMLLMLTVLAVLLGRRVLQPLSRLHLAVQAVARGDISQRCGTEAQDEFGVLSRTFDAMAVDLVSQLRAREGLLRQILDTSSVAIFVVNWQGRLVHANRCMAEMFGWPVDQLVGMEYVQLVHPSQREDGRANLKSLLCNDLTKVEVVRTYWRADQREFWGHLTAQRFIDANGDEAGVLGVVFDVTERHRAELALKESEERFRNALENAPIGMALLSLDGRFTQVNQALCDIVGYQAEALLKLSIDALTYPEDLEKEAEFFSLLEIGQIRTFEIEKRYLRRDGNLVWVQVTCSLLRDANGAPKQIIKQVQEITERKLLEQQLERQARTDFLTGLANRRHFLELAEQELARVRRYSAPLSMAMLDLDHFKEVNDTYGHEVGDKVLKDLAHVCRGMSRDLDVMGRLGGEEFAILLPETTIEQAVDVAERLRLAIEASEIDMGPNQPPLKYTASFGVTAFVESDTHVGSVLHRADLALYRAKHHGRNRTCESGCDPVPSTVADDAAMT